MKRHSVLSVLASAGFSLCAIVGSESPAEAFNTGGHFIITQRALLAEGFTYSALEAVQAATYVPDFWSQWPSSVAFLKSDAQKATGLAAYFHCDTLITPERIEREMAWHNLAMTKVITQAKATRDVALIIDVIGILAHATQDFYSHSNFVDVDWVPWKGTSFPTFNDLPRDIWENPFLTTRRTRPDDPTGLLSGSSTAYSPVPTWARLGSPYPPHGPAAQYCLAGLKGCGVNHDNAQRRFNLNAQITAAIATQELLSQVRSVINDPSLWTAVTHYDGGDAIKDAVAFAQATSMAAGEWGSDGDGKSDVHILESIVEYGGTIWSAWTDKAFSALFALYDAAPPAHAPLPPRAVMSTPTGGRFPPTITYVPAPPYPPETTPLFDATPPSQATILQFASAYSVTWGNQKGTLMIGGSGSPLAGTLKVAPVSGGTPVEHRIIARMRDGALDINVTDSNTSIGEAGLAPGNYTAAPETGLVTGRIYLVGATPGATLAGYLRDATNGVPMGFEASRLQAVLPKGGSGTDVK